MGIPGLNNGTPGAVQVSCHLDVPLETPGSGIEGEDVQVKRWPDSGGLGDRRRQREKGFKAGFSQAPLSISLENMDQEKENSFQTLLV